MLQMLDQHHAALSLADANFFEELQGVAFIPFEDIAHGFQPNGSVLVRPSEVMHHSGAMLEISWS